MGRLTDVVKHLIGINVILFLAVNLIQIPGLQEYFYLRQPGSDGFMPVQIFTHMFMHASLGHIFFNLLMLFFIGPHVESYLGAKKFLLLYFVSGIGAMIIHFLIMDGGALVGASGAIYGIMAAFAVLFPNTKLMLYFLIPVKAKFLVLAIMAFDLYNGLSASQPGIAHFAHLGGALFGILLILYWRNFGK